MPPRPAGGVRVEARVAVQMNGLRQVLTPEVVDPHGQRITRGPRPHFTISPPQTNRLLVGNRHYGIDAQADQEREDCQAQHRRRIVDEPAQRAAKGAQESGQRDDRCCPLDQAGRTPASALRDEGGKRGMRPAGSAKAKT